MVCLGFKPGTAKWLARMNPLSYGATPQGSKKLFLELNDPIER